MSDCPPSEHDSERSSLHDFMDHDVYAIREGEEDDHEHHHVPHVPVPADKTGCVWSVPFEVEKVRGLTIPGVEAPASTIKSANAEKPRHIPSKVVVSLRMAFPNAHVSSQVVESANAILFDEGFRKGQVLWAHSTCPDEINRDRLLEHFRASWGPPFHLGGLAGFPFTGRTGFGAFSHHVPDNGKMLCIFAPHVGINDNGEFGSVRRAGMSCDSSACGAAIGAYKKLAGGCPPIDLIHAISDDDDQQQAFVTKVVAQHLERIKSSDNEMLELVKVFYEEVDKLFMNILPKPVPCPVAVIGGIQVNTPDHLRDRFVLLKFQIIYEDGHVKDKTDALNGLIDAIEQFVSLN